MTPEGLQEVAKDASILIVCTPHQFVYNICKQLRGCVDKTAIAISLTKVTDPSLIDPRYVIETSTDSGIKEAQSRRSF